MECESFRDFLGFIGTKNPNLNVTFTAITSTTSNTTTTATTATIMDEDASITSTPTL